MVGTSTAETCSCLYFLCWQTVCCFYLLRTQQAWTAFKLKKKRLACCKLWILVIKHQLRKILCMSKNKCAWYRDCMWGWTNRFEFQQAHGFFSSCSRPRQLCSLPTLLLQCSVTSVQFKHAYLFARHVAQAHILLASPLHIQWTALDLPHQHSELSLVLASHNVEAPVGWEMVNLVSGSQSQTVVGLAVVMAE